MHNPTANRATEVTGIAPQFSLMIYLSPLSITGTNLDLRRTLCTSRSMQVSVETVSIHLKSAPKTVSDRTHRKQNEHLDAYIRVRGIESLFQELESNGARVIRRLEERPWACKDFYVEDPDGYILCFSEERLLV